MIRYHTLLAAALLAAAAPAAAEVPAHVASAGILPGWREGTGEHIAAVRISLAPGWKTYWRSPGDAGIPPVFDWTGSGNLAEATPVFPVPHVFYQNGVRSVGYKGEVVIPLMVRPARSDAPVSLSGTLEIGVCEEVCIPVRFDLSGELPPAGAYDAAIGDALDSQPISASAAGVTSVTCSVEPISDGIRVTARIAMPPIGGGEVAVLEMPDPAVWISEADMARDGGVLVAVADMVPPSGKPFLVDRSELRITVLSGDRGIEINGCTGG